jgi:hypothetical protein
MIRSFTVVALMCMTSGETATAFDLKTILKDLMPCKYAAIRLCAWPQQVGAAACPRDVRFGPIADIQLRVWYVPKTTRLLR